MWTSGDGFFKMTLILEYTSGASHVIPGHRYKVKVTGGCKEYSRFEQSKLLLYAVHHTLKVYLSFTPELGQRIIIYLARSSFGDSCRFSHEMDGVSKTIDIRVATSVQNVLEYKYGKGKVHKSKTEV